MADNFMTDTAIMTIPKIEQLDRRPYAARDFAKGQGVALGDVTYNIDGIKQRSSYVLSSTVVDDERVKGLFPDADSVYYYAGYRKAAGIAPRFESLNPESQIDTNKASGNEKFLIFQNRKISVNENGNLTIDGNEVFFPDNRIGGNIQKLEVKDLSFTTDKTPLDSHRNKNTPYNPQQNQTNKIKTNDYEGLATEVVGTKRANYNSIYNDGTPVLDGSTQHYTLTPIKAKWDGNAIQITEVITAIQLETQDKFEERNFKFNEKIDISTLQVGKVMKQHLFPEMAKSAEFFATLNMTQAKANAVNGLPDQLKKSKQIQNVLSNFKGKTDKPLGK